MPLESLNEAPGWFGKMSTLGDFARRRLPPEFVQLCDGWLSQVLIAGREQFGERWLQTYLTAPLLRFAWAPGVADGHWWFGVLMPSCDNVGRYFPLLVAQRRARPRLDRLGFDHLEAWLDHLARATARTLVEGETTARFEQALAEAPPWPAASAPAAVSIQWWEAGEHHAFGPRGSIARWLHALAAQRLQERLAGCSMWWCQEEGQAPSAVDVAGGLPDARAFARRLSAPAVSAS